MAQEMMNSSDSRQLSNHGLYTEFCESALLALSLEPLGIQSPDDV